MLLHPPYPTDLYLWIARIVIKNNSNNNTAPAVAVPIINGFFELDLELYTISCD